MALAASLCWWSFRQLWRLGSDAHDIVGGVCRVSLMVGCWLLIATGTALAQVSMPSDTNQFDTLTPDEAATLAAEFPGVQVKWGPSESRYHLLLRALPLNGLTALDPATARELAKYDKGAILLNGVVALSEETAAALAEANTMLALDGLTKLDAEIAKPLARSGGDILAFNGIRSLDPDAAEALARYTGYQLCFDGLKSVSTAVAKHLARFRGDWISLAGVASLDPATATALSAFRGELILDGLTAIDTETAEEIAKSRGDCLNLGAPHLSKAAAAALAEFRGDTLRLGVTSLDADTAAQFLAFRGERLFIDKLKSVDEAAAAIIVKLPAWTGSLYGLEELSPPVARALATSSRQSLRINGVKSLNAESAEALATFKGKWLNLDGITTLDPKAAEALTAFPGHVTTDGLTSLSADTARALARVTKWRGWMPNITALEASDSLAVAEALGGSTGPVGLPNLKRLSPKTFAALKKKKGIDLPPREKLEFIPEPDRQSARITSQ